MSTACKPAPAQILAYPQIRVPHLHDGLIVVKVGYSRATREPHWLQLWLMTIQTGSCRLSPMVDIDLLVQTLRQHGHNVEHVFSVPENAGAYELTIDGNILNLEEARQLLEHDEAK